MHISLQAHLGWIFLQRLLGLLSEAALAEAAKHRSAHGPGQGSIGHLKLRCNKRCVCRTELRLSSSQRLSLYFGVPGPLSAGMCNSPQRSPGEPFPNLCQQVSVEGAVGSHYPCYSLPPAHSPSHSPSHSLSHSPSHRQGRLQAGARSPSAMSAGPLGERKQYQREQKIKCRKMTFIYIKIHTYTHTHV